MTTHEMDKRSSAIMIENPDGVGTLLIRIPCVCGHSECYYRATLYSSDFSHHRKPLPPAVYIFCSKIGAIKEVRTALAYSLKEAKNEVDRLSNWNRTVTISGCAASGDCTAKVVLTYLPDNDHSHMFAVSVTYSE